MGIVSYAQNFEDVILWRALEHIQQGVYIDVGAQDPIVDSVSLAFYQHGWRGIHVEATPVYAEKLRKARPDEAVIQAAVGDSYGVTVFYEIPGTGISTGDEKIAESHRANGFDVHTITVPCITLADVFGHVDSPDIHWLKIDVEGMESRVLKGWGEARQLPWIVVVESTLPLTQIETHQQWEHYLFQRGYQAVYFDGLNRYYISPQHPELIDAFRSGPNVFDRFSLNGTASATFCAQVSERAKRNESKLQEALDQIRQENESLKQVNQAAIAHLENEKEEQAETISRLQLQLRSDLASHAEFERSLQAQIQSLQQEARAVQEEAIHRERVLRNLAEETAHRAQNEALDHLKTLAQREVQYARELQTAQQELLQLQQVAAKEHDEVRRKAISRERELQAFIQELYRRGQTEALLHSNAVAQRDKEYSRELKVLQQKMLSLEQESSLKLLATQQDSSRKLLAMQQQLLQVQQDAAQRESEFRRESAEVLSQAHEEAKSLLERLAAREKQYSHELQLIQQRMLQMQQQTALRQQQIEGRLHDEIEVERQLALELRNSLAQTQLLCKQAHSKGAWRITAPLLGMAGLVFTGRVLSNSDIHVAAATVPQQMQGNPRVQSMNSVAMPIVPSNASPASTLEELLSLHDSYFVACAYKTLLGRPADPEGFAYYLNRLRAGFPKIALLGQLRSSPEGKRHGASVKGLDKALQKYRRGQLPFIGRFLRWLESTESTHPFECRLRGIEGQLQVLSDHSLHRFEQLAKALDDIRGQMSSTRTDSESSGAEPTESPSRQGDQEGMSPRAYEIYSKLAQKW